MFPRILIVCLVAITSSAAGRAQPAATPSAPRLVLMLSIDQMRFDLLDRFSPLYRAGLKTLVERGAVFSNANYRHAASETGPGHSVLLTGSHPSHSGIVANDWWDPFLKKVINVIDDPVQSPLGGEGRSASPANLLTFTVGDVLKSKDARARVVGVSAKDRSAILMGGRRADAAYWLENSGGNFITSTYYVDAAPVWLGAWNQKRAIDRFAGQTWDRVVKDPALYEKYAGKDAVAGERDGKDITFPHPIVAKPPQTQYYAELRRTPFLDDIVLDFALETMARHELGKDTVTDVLAIGFAATDGIGHQWGPDSHEQMDQMLRVDLLIGRLLDHINASVGLDNTIVILSADHGSRPLVELSQSKGVPARRVPPKQLEASMRGALEKRYPGMKDLVSHFAIDVYLDEDAIRRHKLAFKDVEATAIEGLMASGLVERVYTFDDLRSTVPSTDPHVEAFRNAFFAPRSPHLAVMLKRDVYMTSNVGGTGHGSVYEFDRHVPVVFMGRTIEPGRYAAPSGPEDIAPTLGRLLNVEFPRESDARVLEEMLAR